MKFAPIFLLCAWILLGLACSSTAPKDSAYLLRMVDYRTGARLELVNPAHTTAVVQYSKVRADPSRKVTDEAWMSGLIEYLKDEGWSKEEKSGNAPTMAKDSLRWSLEMVGPGGTSFVAQPMNATGSQLSRLTKIRDAFVATYNATSGFQAVRSEPGQLPFKVPDYPSPTKKGGK